MRHPIDNRDMIYRRTLHCEINGKRVVYDACSSGELEAAKQFYREFDYIGTNDKGIWVDGVSNFKGETYHFFIRKTNK